MKKGTDVIVDFDGMNIGHLNPIRIDELESVDVSVIPFPYYFVDEYEIYMWRGDKVYLRNDQARVVLENARHIRSHYSYGDTVKVETSTRT